MIIKRKYEWLGVLYKNDANSKEVIDKAFSLKKIDDELKKKLLDYNHYHIPAFLNIGCGIPGECYSFFMKEFEKLDKSNPYDNGLSFKEVTGIEYETSRKGTAIQMRFVCEKAEVPYRIVGFAAVENKEASIAINKGWEMTPPFEIG